MKPQHGLALAVLGLVSAVAVPAAAADLVVTMNAISASGVGAPIGTISIRESRHGLVLTPRLANLAPPGPHGFHVHEKPDCGPGPGPTGQPAAGLAAGGHYDPAKAGRHHGPHARDGHLGDLPPLVVNTDGTADIPVLAPRLKRRDLAGRSIMIHVGGDNYSDQPAPLGGGGARIACGLVK